VVIADANELGKQQFALLCNTTMDQEDELPHRWHVGRRSLILLAATLAGVCAVAYIGASSAGGIQGFNRDVVEAQFEALTDSASPNDWGYSSSNGPAVWASMTGLNKDCSKGVFQSPIDIRAADVSSKINGLAPLGWVYSSDGGAATESYDGRAFIITFPGAPPTITTLDFSKYLDVVPLSAVANTTYSLKKIVLHTPSETLLDGARCAPDPRAWPPFPNPRRHVSFRAAQRRKRD
jgi:hypothetical protein